MSTSNRGEVHGTGTTLQFMPTSRPLEQVLSSTDEKETSGPGVSGTWGPQDSWAQAQEGLHC